MFAAIRSEILDRIFSINVLTSASKALSPGRARSAAKGLVFVQNYATYEYTVSTAVEAALDSVTGHGIELRVLRTGLQTIAMDAELESIANSKRRSSWDKRTRIFDRAISGDAAVLSGCEFPDDGNHFRFRQLETLWKLFGLSVPVLPENRLIGRIDEMVEHRNAIAHGRDTADRIGGRFSDAEISDRITDTQNICVYIVDAFEDHCSNPTNLTR